MPARGVPGVIDASVSTTKGIAVRPAFPREQTGDRQMNQIQENARKATQAINAMPFGRGVYFKNVAFTSGTPVALAHGLGSAARFFAMNASAAARFFFVANSDASLDAKQIQVQSDATCSADVWIYVVP